MDEIPSEANRSTERTAYVVVSAVTPYRRPVDSAASGTPCCASRRARTSPLIALHASSRPLRMRPPALPSFAGTSPLPHMHAISDRRAIPNVSSPLSSALSSAPDRKQHHEPKVPRVHCVSAISHPCPIRVHPLSALCNLHLAVVCAHATCIFPTGASATGP